MERQIVELQQQSPKATPKPTQKKEREGKREGKREKKGGPFILKKEDLNCPLCKQNGRRMDENCKFSVLCQVCWRDQSRLVRNINKAIDEDRQKKASSQRGR
jgi:hypothetical protein